jgi:hypothetical protein
VQANENASGSLAAHGVAAARRVPRATIRVDHRAQWVGGDGRLANDR